MLSFICAVLPIFKSLGKTSLERHSCPFFDVIVWHLTLKTFQKHSISDENTSHCILVSIPGFIVLIRGLSYLAGFIEAVNSMLPWQISLLFKFSAKKKNALIGCCCCSLKTDLQSRMAYFAFRVAHSYIADDIGEYPRWFVNGAIVRWGFGSTVLTRSLALYNSIRSFYISGKEE